MESYIKEIKVKLNIINNKLVLMRKKMKEKKILKI